MRLSLHQVTSKCDLKFTDGRLWNNYWAGAQEGDEDDIHRFCKCFIAAHSWHNVHITRILSKSARLGTISRFYRTEFIAKTYTAYSHKNPHDNNYPSKEALATAIECISAHSHYDWNVLWINFSQQTSTHCKRLFPGGKGIFLCIANISNS